MVQKYFKTSNLHSEGDISIHSFKGKNMGINTYQQYVFSKISQKFQVKVKEAKKFK